MQHPPDTTTISTVEDLDPEPSGGRLAPRRELILGMLLILGVLIWSGWQWRRQTSLETAYRAGRDSALRQEWDAARDHFLSASGFRDADARAQTAAERIAERNRLYAQALAAAQRRDWPATLQAANATRRVQPSYKEIERLNREATAQVYQAALSGTIALRLNGYLSGLFYRDPYAWLPLQGSDADSRVRGIGTSNRVTYDVPGPGPPPPDAPRFPSMTRDPGSPHLAGRRLVAATLTGPQLSFTPLAFDPAFYNSYIWGEKGAWALRYKPSASLLKQNPGLRGGFGDYDIAYQPFGSPITSPLALPGPGWVVMDFSRDGERLLLADVSAYTPANPTSSIYVAAADGTERRLIFTHRGGITGATFDPDGRRALALTYTPLRDDFSEDQRIMLLDLSGASPSRTLIEKFDNPASVDVTPPVGAAFVASRPRTGEVLLAEWHRGVSYFSFFAPLDFSPSPARVSVNGNPAGQMWALEQEGSPRLVLAWANGARGLPFADNLTVATVDGGSETILTRVNLDELESLNGAWVRGDHLIFSSQPLAYYSPGEHNLYTLPLAALGQPSVRATAIYSETVPSPRPSAREVAGWELESPVSANLGTGMLAYIKGRDLHARTYDGSIDLVLEQDVRRFFPFDRYERSTRLR